MSGDDHPPSMDDTIKSNEETATADLSQSKRRQSLRKVKVTEGDTSESCQEKEKEESSKEKEGQNKKKSNQNSQESDTDKTPRNKRQSKRKANSDRKSANKRRQISESSKTRQKGGDHIMS